SDMQWPTLQLVLKATVTATGAASTITYIPDPYRPLTTGVYVKGPRNTRDAVVYQEAAAVDAGKVQPLVVRNDLTDEAIGLGRRIATNPSAYGYDPALVGLGMQGAVVDAPRSVALPSIQNGSFEDGLANWSTALSIVDLGATKLGGNSNDVNRCTSVDTVDYDGIWSRSSDYGTVPVWTKTYLPKPINDDSAYTQSTSNSIT
ncbi:MAG: hypothetical protein ACK46D_11700, partial [Roseiflexaceae bacterium]